MATETSWESAISEIGANLIRVRGYDVAALMEKASFSDVIYLLLKGELPDEKTSEMMRAILVSSVDHGVTPPSVLATRTVMSAGNSLNTAVAAGVLAIGDVHGGAIEQSARIMQELAAQDGSTAELANKLVADLKASNKRMPGFGHRLHTADPRTARMFALAAKLQFAGRHVELALAIEQTLAESSGRKLPINVDGAIAAVISDMGFDWRLGKGFFIISRVAGLVAHAYEEKTTQRPMRKLGNTDCTYTGPPAREL
ncbi:MAG: citryl-CoA lyase [bacterium]